MSILCYANVVHQLNLHVIGITFQMTKVQCSIHSSPLSSILAECASTGQTHLFQPCNCHAWNIHLKPWIAP